MKRIICVVMAVLALSAASWSESALTDSQMRIFAGIKTANSWTAAAMGVEAVRQIILWPAGSRGAKGKV